MKLRTFLLTMVLVLSANLRADEGMWTLYNLPKAVYEQMQSYGFQLPSSSLYDGDNAIKNSVVNFSGFCSGVVVSPDGLVFTNHHCGFEAIRSHSTVEHDYMLNGFYAKTYEEELPNENMFVSFMVDQKDITDYVESFGLSLLKPSQQAVLLDSIEREMSNEVAKQDSTLRLEVKAFYEGNRFYATTYRDFTDIRLVFAIPKSMGKFGGETDNWMWPRQTCDFSVFRIYADPTTGGPAEYSEANVPYHPKSWTKVSLQGYKDGDFAMTMGYPGSTSRYLSSYGIEMRRDAVNAVRAQVRGVKQEVMIKHMRADEAVRIKYDSKYAQSSNYWKNSIGMNKCIDSIGLIKEKRLYEEKIKKYQQETGLLQGKLDFSEIERVYSELLPKRRQMLLFQETFRGTSELVNRAMRLSGGIEVKGPKEQPKKQYVEFEDNSDKWDEALDKEVMAVLLKNYAEQTKGYNLPDFYKTIETRFDGDYAAYVDYLYAHSMLMKKGEKIYINKKSYKEDLGVQLGIDLTEHYGIIREGMEDLFEQVDVQEKYLCDAKIRMEQDLPHYSDANFTMRLSYGQVGGYELDGKPSGYYTTAASIVEKMKRANEVIEYEAEPIMHDLLSAKDFGKYGDPETGTMQLCFLTNNDITGGNSGSPMFDGKGRLIGLAFDGNWDSLSNDIHFDSRLGRCIGVDIRYVMFMMDKWGHADRLLKEINAE